MPRRSTITEDPTVEETEIPATPEAEQVVTQPAQTEPQPTDFEERQREKDWRIANADREAIDRIILDPLVQNGGTIRIERRGPTDTDFAYLVTVNAEQFKDIDRMLDLIKHKYGGGEYRCTSFRANKKPYKPFGFNIDNRYEGTIGRRDPENANGGLEKVITALSRPKDDGFKTTDLLKLMEISNDKSDKMMMLMVTMMTKSQETMATTMTALFTALATQKKDGVDPLLLELIRTNKPTPTPVAEYIDAIRSIKELSEPEREPEKEETMLDKILKAASMMIPGMAPQPQQLPQPPQPGQLPAPGPQPAQPAGGIPLQFRVALGMILDAAERDCDPATYAEMVLDQCASLESIKTAKQLLTPDDWKLRLFGDESKIAHIAPWLDDLRAQVLEGLNAPTDSQPEQPSPGDGGESAPK